MASYSALIIDDDVWMQRILSKTLQSYGFRTTYLASNGYEGIGLAVEHQPTLIIVDILMPELTGHMTLKVLKHIKQTKAIPVVVVSALSDVENLGLAVKSGTAGFISKPFTRATVFDKLVDIFGREKLEHISKGVPIDDIVAPVQQQEKETPENDMFELDFSKLDSQAKPSSTDDDETKKHPVQPDVVLRHYQDEEKKSIESIKKLLLKTKKE